MSIDTHIHQIQPQVRGAQEFAHIVVRVDRSRAFRRARWHSAMVKVLRLIFPICAIGAVLLYFVSSKISLSVGGVNVSVAAIELASENLKFVNPRLEGFTDKNGRYLVTAKSAVQDPAHPDLIKLNHISARLVQSADRWVRLVADSGLYHAKKEELDLKGDVRVEAGNGMKAKLETAKLSIRPQWVSTDRPVFVEMLNGWIRSQSMVLFVQEKRVRFVGQVRVKIKKRAAGGSKQRATGLRDANNGSGARTSGARTSVLGKKR